MDGGPQLREGGSDSVFYGSLIRRLDPIRLANLSDAAGGVETEQNLRFTIRGLCSQLTVHVGVALVKGPADGTNMDPILPSEYPAIPGTMQITPIVNNPQAPKAYLREVFQDPTAVGTDNANHPLGQDIPFGWSFNPGGADEARVDVVIPAAAYVAESLVGTLVGLVTVEYTGSWWDVRTVQKAIGNVNVPAGDDVLPSILTAGG